MIYLLALLAGGLHACSVAWPFDSLFAQGQGLSWLQAVSLGVLVAGLSHSTDARHGARVAWSFALGSLSGSFWWLFISMHTYGGLAAPLAVLAVLALAGALALLYAAAGALYVWLRPEGAWGRSLIFAAVWTLAELARGNWLTGFPWGAGGYAHVDGPLAAYAPWLGVYGVGAVAAWLAAMVVQWGARADRQPKWTAVAVAAVLLGPLLVQQAWPQRDDHSALLDVTLLQGNIAQNEKFEEGTGVVDSLRWYGDELRKARTSLVVAPETAIPLLPQDLPPGYWEALGSQFIQAGQPGRAALVGVPLGDRQLGYTNSVVGFRPGLPGFYQYDKQHLVPFGEFIPTGFKWFTRMMNIPLGDFNRGALVQPSFDWQGQRLATNICYEDLFGEELGARFEDAATAPTILVNMSNLGWFGDSVAIDQHLNIARMRSLEFARPTLRATNTGATVIIDHHGAVTQSLPRLQRGVLVGQVRGQGLRADGGGMVVTPYAWWVSRLGLWPLWALALAVLALAYRHRPVRT